MNEQQRQEIIEIFGAVVKAFVLLAEQLDKSNALSKQAFAEACDKLGESDKEAHTRILFTKLAEELRKSPRDRASKRRH